MNREYLIGKVLNNAYYGKGVILGFLSGPQYDIITIDFGRPNGIIKYKFPDALLNRKAFYYESDIQDVLYDEFEDNNKNKYEFKDVKIECKRCGEKFIYRRKTQIEDVYLKHKKLQYCLACRIG